MKHSTTSPFRRGMATPSLGDTGRKDSAPLPGWLRVPATAPQINTHPTTQEGQCHVPASIFIPFYTFIYLFLNYY